MFTLRSSFKRAVLAIAALSFVWFGFTGCQQETDDDNDVTVLLYNLYSQLERPDSTLIGTWLNSTYGEYFEINSSTFRNYGTSWESYEGNNLYVRKTSATSGYIYMKYTKAATASWTYSTDPAQAPDVGKWYAVAYKNLSASSIDISGAYKANGSTSKDDVFSAMSEFTIDNGYFSIFSTCARQ